MIEDNKEKESNIEGTEEGKPETEAKEEPEAEAKEEPEAEAKEAVSYTHLTLPTMELV